MQIESVRIQNFRAFKDETVYFNNYTCLVGPNGAGKSTVLCALNIFFRSTADSPLDLTSLEQEDFFQKDVSEPITITVTFKDVSSEAQQDFAAYYRGGKLVVSAQAKFDPQAGTAIVKQYGLRNAMKAFAGFFESVKAGKKVAELVKLFEELRKQYPEIQKAKTKDQMIEALNAYEGAHSELCELLPSEDEFYGVSKGADKLEEYLQWVFVPAVKDVMSEQSEGKTTALGKILERTVRSKVDFEPKLKSIRDRGQDEYKQLLAANQSALDTISTSLQKRLTNWAHPDATLRLEWRQDLNKAVRVENPFAEIIAGEGEFEGNLARFGHGLQRSYLLALLQELAGSDDTGAPRLLLAIEEPELYQHPPQARHLAEILKQLAKTNSQVIICTHSPYFVSGEAFQDVRLIRKPKGKTSANSASVTFDEIARSMASARGGKALARPAGMLVKINQELQPSINEIFFASVLILVEGLEDVAYITTYLHLMDKWDECRRLGAHIVPSGGKNHMLLPIAIAKALRIPFFAIFDSDGHVTDSTNRGKHERDNLAIQALCGVTSDAFPADTRWCNNMVSWRSEIGSVIANDFVEADLRPCQEAARARCGSIKDLEKNSLFIADWLHTAWDLKLKSATLERLCMEILKFANSGAKL